MLLCRQMAPLPSDIELLDLETFTTPKYYLPPSLHEAMFENVWHWQDVYREKVDQEHP